MAKKRILVPILALILVLLVSVGLFVACDKDPVEYTVTFDYGDGRTTSVTVNEGTALTAEQIPSDVVAPGSNVAFDGWFVEETKVDAGYVVKANVTATAHKTNLYTLTFKNGTEVLKTVTVRAGSALTADDFPTFTPESNFEFDGWFIGQDEVEVGFVVNADATVNTVTTELFTVTFKNGEEIVKTISNVKSGSVIDANDLPDDPAPAAGYAFTGWFVGQDAYDETAPVTANLEVVAKFDRNAHLVTFKNGEEVLDTVVVAYEGTLATAQIPASATGEGVFVGFFNEGVKAVDGLAISGDTTFVATFVSEADYEGAWIDDENGQMMIFNGSKVRIEGKEVAWTFDSTTGEAVYSASKYRMLVINDTLLVSHEYWDGINEEMKTDNFTFVKPSTNINGTFYRSKNEKMIVENGVILQKDDSTTYYGYISATETGYSIKCKNSAYSGMVTATATVDANGNIVGDVDTDSSFKGIWVKTDVAPADYTARSDAGYQIFHVYTLNEEQVVVYQDVNNVYCFASADVAFEEGAIVTVTYGENQTVKGKISDTSFILPGEEEGTYTGAEGTLVLDGLNNATLADVKKAYLVNGKGYILMDEKAYVLGEGTYTVISEKDGLQGDYTDADNWKYTYSFDGFGGAIVKYASSYSTTIYTGEYSLNQEKTQLTIANVNYSFDGVYDIFEEGKVLVFGSTTIIKNGATFTDRLEELLGYWTVTEGGTEHELLITTYTEEDYYGEVTRYIFVQMDGGYDRRATGNYNNSQLAFSDSDGQEYILAIGNDVEGTKTVVLSWTEYAGPDEYGEDVFNDVERTYSYVGAEKPAPSFTSFETDIQGTWKGKDAATGDELVVVITLDAITLNGDNGTDLRVEEVYGANNYYFTIGSAWPTTWVITYFDGACTMWVDGTTGSEITLTKEAAKLDAFAGTYTKDSFVLVFDGNGNGTWNDGNKTYNFTYTVSGNTAAISGFASFDGKANKATLTATGVSVQFNDNYDENPYSAELTKQAEQEEPPAPVLDAFAGTWSNGTVTVTFDGKGNGTWDETAFTYTVAGGEATFSMSGYEIYVTVATETSLYMVDDCDGEFVVGMFNKTEQLDAYAGTWSNGTVTVTFDGKGNGTWDGTAFTYTVAGGEATFSMSGYEIYVTVATETSLYMVDDCDGEFVVGLFNKQ